MKTAILLNISFSFLSSKNMGLCAGLRRRAVVDRARVRIRFARVFLARRAESFRPEDLSLAASFAAKAGIASMRIIRIAPPCAQIFRTHGTIMGPGCPRNPLVGLKFL